MDTANTTETEVTFQDAPKAPEILRLTLKQKTLWETFKTKCRGLSPSKLIDFFNSEKDRIMRLIKVRGYITEEEREFLNKGIRERIDKVLDEFKEQAVKQMEIQPEDTPEEIQFKVSFGERLLRWLTDLFEWLIEKIKRIFSWIKEKLEWCFEKAKQLFEFLWSIFK